MPDYFLFYRYEKIRNIYKSDSAEYVPASEGISPEPFGKERIYQSAGFLFVLFHEIQSDHSFEDPLHRGEGQAMFVEKSVDLGSALDSFRCSR